MVFAEFDLRPVKHQQKPSQIPLYKKANWDLMKEDMASLNDHISSMYKSGTAGVNEMWIKFRDTIQDSIILHIPHRQSKVKNGYPWIEPDFKRLMGKEHRLYKKKKKTGDTQDAQQYLELKVSFYFQTNLIQLDKLFFSRLGMCIAFV